MKRSMSPVIKPAVILVAFCALASIVSQRNEVREYRGQLKYPIIAVGGETTGVALVTPGQNYELALSRAARRSGFLVSLNGRTVIATGRLTTRKGRWRPRRHILYVEHLERELQDGSREAVWHRQSELTAGSSQPAP